jgi:hypothetical protein
MSSPLTTLAMGAISAAGTIAQGNYGLEVAKGERKQLNRMASEELAVATRGAEAAARGARLLTSRGQAVAASSGGLATDESVLNIIGDIAKEGNVQQRGILRTGQVKADDLMYRGKVGVVGARFNRNLSRWAAGGTMLEAAAKAAEQAAGMGGGGSGSAFAKYGGGAPGGYSSDYPVTSSAYSSWYNTPTRI